MSVRKLFGDTAADTTAPAGNYSNGFIHRAYNCKSFCNVKVKRVSDGILTCWPDVTA